MYYEINEQAARTAHDMRHFGTYQDGSCTAQYRQAVDNAAALVEDRKKKVSPYYHEKLDSLLDSYARRLAAWQNDYNRNAAKYPSQFISGAGGFNMNKHNKQMNREDALWKEYEEIQGILEKIKSTGTGPVDLADPHARELLTEQLNRCQKSLDRAKALNAWYRKHKSFVGFPDLTPEQAEQLSAQFANTLQQCPWVDKPYPDYELSSLRGKIKRITARLAELDALEAAAESPSDSIIFDGGEIIQNAALNRVQIIFDDIPAPATRTALKSYGFRWSPTNKAWQRQLTENALRDAKNICSVE